MAFVAMAAPLTALAWRAFAAALHRMTRSSVSFLAVWIFLAGTAVVALVILVDYTRYWGPYDASGPHGQTSKCPPTNGEWHQGQVILLAIAVVAAVGAILVAHHARRVDRVRPLTR